MPSMAPSHAGPAPMVARNAGSTAVAISWLQSLKRLVSPTPRTVRLSQDCSCGASAMGWSVVEAPTLDEPRREGHCARLFLGGAIENYPHFLERDEAAFDHFVEAGKNFFDALDGFDDLEDDGQVLGQAESLVGVIDARPAVAGHAAQHGDTGKAVFAQHLHNGVVERLSVPFVRFADVDAHQRALAFEFFVSHHAPRTYSPDEFLQPKEAVLP